jgi:LytR cell envelope-related transcriptional attenuator
VNRRTAASAVALLAVVGAVAAITLSTRGGEAPAQLAPARSVSELVLLVVEAPPEPLAAVVGWTSDGCRAVVIPTDLPITIPGQGEGSVSDVVAAPGRTGQIAVSNLLGMWVDHHAVTDLPHLSAVIDRAGGIEVGGITRTGAETVASLGAGPGRELAWRTTLGGLLASGLAWEPSDYLDVDAIEKVSAILGGGERSVVEPLPTRVSAGGLEEPDYEHIGAVLTAVFGAAQRPIIPVIVLNGSGAPGVGEDVAKRIVPDGYRVVVSANASTFDHTETLIVAGSQHDRQVAEHVRDLLGVGQVVVSGPPSGIAQLTIVVGKDFGTG